MIIDVADLELKMLQFNKRYDTNRYKRGTNIYNLPQIKQNKGQAQQPMMNMSEMEL